MQKTIKMTTYHFLTFE